ncbi:MAG: biotin transporter BioY [Alphaproteobacteria bacterium]
MSSNVLAPTTLLNRVLSREAEFSFLEKAFLAVVGSLILTLSAKIVIPFWPVPSTMQTLAVFALGVVYGPSLAAASIAIYFIEGAFGLPVFTGTPAKGIGLAYMAGPTMGFLMGFIPSAYVAGKMVESGYGATLKEAAMVMTASALVLYAFGLPWLTYLFGFEVMITSFISWLPGTLAKAGLGVAGLMKLMQYKAAK